MKYSLEREGRGTVVFFKRLCSAIALTKGLKGAIDLSTYTLGIQHKGSTSLPSVVLVRISESFSYTCRTSYVNAIELGWGVGLRFCAKAVIPDTLELMEVIWQGEKLYSSIKERSLCN